MVLLRSYYLFDEEDPKSILNLYLLRFLSSTLLADHILELALSPKRQGVPKDLFQKCVGIAIISVVEVGFIFSGNVGTGILLKKMKDDTWSPPCALGLGGVGWGFLIGGAIKEIMIFIFDDNTMEGMCGDAGVRLGGQLNLTLGPFGRNYEAGLGVSNKGAVGTFSVAFSKGAFLGASVEGAMLGPRSGVNDGFYGQSTTPRSVINGEVTMPNKPTLIQGVYDKLTKLAEGESYTPTPEETQTTKQAAAAAQKASEQVAAADLSVQKVDAAAEAAKEGHWN
jgi:lipid-binding SYLF domain-containing protein